jgi:hypothetical protein
MINLFRPNINFLVLPDFQLHAGFFINLFLTLRRGDIDSVEVLLLSIFRVSCTTSKIPIWGPEITVLRCLVELRTGRLV